MLEVKGWEKTLKGEDFYKVQLKVSHYRKSRSYHGLLKLETSRSMEVPIKHGEDQKDLLEVLSEEMKERFEDVHFKDAKGKTKYYYTKLKSVEIIGEAKEILTKKRDGSHYNTF